MKKAFGLTMLVVILLGICMVLAGCADSISEEQKHVDTLAQKAISVLNNSQNPGIQNETKGFHLRYNSLEALIKATASLEDLDDAAIPQKGDLFIFYNNSDNMYAAFTDDNGEIAYTMDYQADKKRADSLMSRQLTNYYQNNPFQLELDLEEVVVLYGGCKWLALTSIQITQLSNVETVPWIEDDVFHQLTSKQMESYKK